MHFIIPLLANSLRKGIRKERWVVKFKSGYAWYNDLVTAVEAEQQ